MCQELVQFDANLHPERIPFGEQHHKVVSGVNLADLSNSADQHSAPQALGWTTFRMDIQNRAENEGPSI